MIYKVFLMDTDNRYRLFSCDGLEIQDLGDSLYGVSDIDIDDFFCS